MTGGDGWRLVVHDSLPSTSDTCIDCAEAGQPAGLALLALRQTRARGSRGRGWIEPPVGNLAISVLLRPQGGVGLPALWPLLAGLALHQALSQDDPDGRLSLKWPNDVMLDGRKLAGILIERGANDGQDWLVIGFGANLASAPVLPDRVAACMAELGPPSTPQEVASRLLMALDDWGRLASTGGFPAIRTAWLDRAYPVGTPLAVRERGEQRAGSFAGLSDDGALLLDVAGREQRIDTGEILLLEGN